MADTNTTILHGRLTRDTVLAYLPSKNSGSDSGTAVCTFDIANNRKWGDKEHVLYMPVKVFGKQAETCNQYLAKGRAVTVTGRLQQENWEAKDGQKRSKIVLIANEVQFIGDGQNAKPAQEAKAPLPEPTPDFPADDIPF